MDLTNKKELKRVWVEALRSGEYEQTTGTLHNLDDGGSCCLGVAAKVWGLASFEFMGVHPNEQDDDGNDDEGPKGIYIALDEISGSTRYKSGAIERHPAFERGIDMNDSGCSFAEIADMIEGEWDV